MSIAFKQEALLVHDAFGRFADALGELATSGADLFARITIERYTWDTKRQTVRESWNEASAHP